METDRALEADLCLFTHLSISFSAKVASGPGWDAVAHVGAQWALGQQLLYTKVSAILPIWDRACSILSIFPPPGS